MFFVTLNMLFLRIGCCQRLLSCTWLSFSVFWISLWLFFSNHAQLVWQPSLQFNETLQFLQFPQLSPMLLFPKMVPCCISIQLQQTSRFVSRGFGSPEMNFIKNIFVIVSLVYKRQSLEMVVLQRLHSYTGRIKRKRFKCTTFWLEVVNILWLILCHFI